MLFKKSSCDFINFENHGLLDNFQIFHTQVFLERFFIIIENSQVCHDFCIILYFIKKNLKIVHPLIN